MKKILYIDIDCIARPDLTDEFQTSPITFSPGLFQYLSRIANSLDYGLVLSKQEIHTSEFINEVIRFCRNEQILFDEVLSPGEIAQRLKYAKAESNVLVCKHAHPNADIFMPHVIYMEINVLLPGNQKTWADIFASLSSDSRKATIHRKTSETDIECFINLDGSGKNEISTGLGFFDHMLQQIAKHGDVDLTINVKGDLHIDEHHTIEDVGLALGAAFNEALGTKKGIERYAFLLPMDDCLAQVALDFGGRPWLVWDANFNRETIGDVPTEMFYHFFKSFSDTAKCNLNIKASGDNEHHKIESIFKAFAKSIRMAVSKTGNNSIPSTKGTL